MGHILSRQFSCQGATIRHIPDIPGWGFCLSTGRCTGASSTRHCCFPGAKVSDFISPTWWPPNSRDLNPVDYSTWSVGLLQVKVYRSIIANVSELDMRLINERDALSSRSWMLLSASGAVVSPLLSLEPGPPLT